MASLTALVTGLASSVERATVGSSAVARDVAKLSARIALHGLGLAISGKVVGATALVAGSRTGTATETTSAAVATSESTAGDRTATAHGGTDGVGASTLHVCQSDALYRLVRETYGKVTGLAAVVAAAAGAGAAQAEGRAVSLDVAQTLAVVALLSLGGTGQGAAVGLVACRILVYVDGGQRWKEAVPGCLQL